MILSNKFISATPAFEYGTYTKIVPAPYMRKSFMLEKIPEKAEITVTGLGFYKLFVNGKDITKGILAPYISNSDQTVYYDNYDIKQLLCAGENVVAFMLGDGLQNCISGQIWSLDLGAQRSSPKLAFAIEYDGNVIEADESVMTHDSPILFNALHCGVHYDATLEIDGWNMPGFDASSWKKALRAETPRGEKVLCTSLPVVIKEELKAVSVKENVLLNDYKPSEKLSKDTFYDSAEDDKTPGYLYDFGQQNSGVIRLKIKGKKGQRIVLQMCERIHPETQLPDYANIYFCPAGFSQRDIYICKGTDEEIWVPDFTYHGFQCVHVTGISPEQATDDLITYLVCSADLEQRCDFKCSDEMANKIWEASKRSDLSNFYYFPTDCPHREKLGWTGDASLSAEHFLLKFNVEKNLSEWFTSIRNAQRYDGNIPGIIPTTGWGFDWGNGPLFDSVIFNVPYYMYLYLGDTDIIKDNAIMMMRYLDFISKKRDERGLICYGLGDWCPVNKNCDDYDVPLEFTDSAMTMDSARKAALMFRAAGLENQAEFAEGLYYEMRDAIRSNLIDFNTMTVEGASQTGQAIALAFGIFDPAERSEAYTRLLEAVSEYDEHIHTGILGGRYIFHVLRDFGDADLAYHMITRKDFPSYGYWMEQGATTLWEIFHKDVNYYSTNHHFWGDVTSWFVKTALGIRVNPNEDNPNHIDIEPYFISDMDSASGHYDSLCGKLEVKWMREGENVRFTVICPEGITGKIKLPFGFKHNDKYVLPLKAGTNEIIATKTF